MVGVEPLVDALDLEPTGEGTFRGQHVVANNYGVVFGGQLLAQSLIAGLSVHEGKRAKTLHIIFARGASPESPLDITVEQLHGGRSFGSSTVTIAQGDRVCTRALLLAAGDDDDVIHHEDAMPAVGEPPTVDAGDEWQVEVVGDVDVSDPDQVGPPELDVWSRFPGAPTDPVTGQALLAFASDGFLIGTAMRPHPGVGQSQAHKTLTTGVVSHTLTFHQPFSAADWLLLSHHSPFAGFGRCYGRANAFTPGGTLVASYVQDGMLRPRDPSKGAL